MRHGAGKSTLVKRSPQLPPTTAPGHGDKECHAPPWKPVTRIEIVHQTCTLRHLTAAATFFPVRTAPGVGPFKVLD